MKTDSISSQEKEDFGIDIHPTSTPNSEGTQEVAVNPKWLQFKIDCWIVFPICLLYLLAFLDRVNISNANAYGMSTDIGLKGQEYNIALAVFFVPYIVFEIPANYLLKKFSPHVFLSACLLAFGGVSIGQGFVKNYHELIVTRVLLGALETAMFPSCFYLLGCWYTRVEAQKRYSFFFSSTSLAGAFGGLIAYGVNRFHNKFGIEGWRWIFIVEGSITAFCGIILFFLIADFPEQAKFINKQEKQFIKEKLEKDLGDSNFEHKITFKEICNVFKDWKLMAVALMYFGCVVGGYGYAYFSVAIIKTFGLSPIDVQVHSIYPWIATFGVNMIIAYFSDWTKHRFSYVVGSLLVSIVGYGMLLGTPATESYKHARYGACFLVVMGLFTAMPLIICWANMNFAGHTRKMVASAFQVGFANIGGIIAVFIYKSNEAPGYSTGVWVSLACVLLSLASSTSYFLGLMRTNKFRQQGGGCEHFNSLSPEEQKMQGDLNPEFRYMY